MAVYTPGSLVNARGRDWVVLPGGDDDFLIVRPLGGREDETAAILTNLEPVRQASFPPPSADDAGDAVSARLLRTALRIGFRSTAGPFRSLAGLAVEPRPYQLVPLLMAMRLETVRLLIADDVGIGKTIEAGLIAAELLAQGAVNRLTVLCGPALAEQWQEELRGKFHIDAELVLPSTVKQLERNVIGDDRSIFDHYPYTVVSTDFIKSPRRRDEFLQSCPELVIVDEAHTCVADGGSGAATLRYELLRRIAERPDRHLLLVTATPHSGKEEGFRNLIGLLDPELATVDLETRAGRERLARHMVQRRRGDIISYLGKTTFPERRETREERYHLGDEYHRLVRRVLAYAKETVADASGDRLRQRVRYWSVLALLRALASSPRAAAATLRKRAKVAESETPEEADRIGRATVLDLADDEANESVDVLPGADDVAEDDRSERARLLRFAREADALAGDKDAKLAKLDEVVQGLLADGFDPIVFCRFIDTAEYVAEHLRASLGQAATVECVTGTLPPGEREARIDELSRTEGRHVLVATDCLSEGVNLQDTFQAVVHYDLAWNPTRHEQREGRVDRFGQVRDVVRAVTMIGADNVIDEIVMRVLLRKHEAIRRRLGVSVPVPNSSNLLVEALMEELLTSGGERWEQLPLNLSTGDLHREWESSADREKASRTKFAQAGIKPDEVAREIEEIRASLGSNDEIERFVRDSLEALGSSLTDEEYGFTAVTATLPAGLRDTLPPGHPQPLPFHRHMPAPRRHAHLDRTDPAVAAIARYVLDSALDPTTPGPRPARRCGVMRTAAVQRRTTLLLARFRMHLELPVRGGVKQLVAEEAQVLAFRGRPDDPQWLPPEEVEALLSAEPAANIPAELARDDLERLLVPGDDGRPALLARLEPALNAQAAAVAERLRASHARVREASRQSGAARITVTPHTPVDLLGIYVYLPASAGGL
ncbi:ATP-dependent helicase HepA [Thermopolyspora flexuosa]|uniref:SNF2 family DNA or RNA helicase n=1 Tax=Thermopolyspora flexuosa TaxID=103836 RepID=A0A543J3Q6_9ACTN|nr:helicase-related protein [Thermopolyspora flexuosa]TQM77452.1 SNF2 family DNA or RNA helicase [Thermopolyspora flexuosa]GGM73222.1 ATP-dependent helicase HepA [Thermopolyspora flexuosa]